MLRSAELSSLSASCKLSCLGQAGCLFGLNREEATGPCTVERSVPAGNGSIRHCVLGLLPFLDSARNSGACSWRRTSPYGWSEHRPAPVAVDWSTPTAGCVFVAMRFSNHCRARAPWRGCSSHLCRMLLNARGFSRGVPCIRHLSHRRREKRGVRERSRPARLVGRVR